ncbi:MAG: serine hydrolase domain-containing protein, partial [Candidatus Aminicenantales bacterium]
MKKSRLLTILFLCGAAALTAMTCARTDSGARIARVENGLMSPVVIKGDPSGNIVDRMKHYGIPG